MSGPDPQQVRRFLEALDPDADAFTFQTFDDSDLARGHVAKVIHGPISEAGARLATLNKSGAGIFVTVNETDLRGRKAENVRRVRAVFADLDGAPLEPVMACGLDPHIVVESSPGRFHTYWLVDGLPLDRFAPAQKAIAGRFNGDRSVHDLPRVLRLPGFWHRKGEPFMTRLVEVNDGLPYSAERIEGEFPPVEPEWQGNGKATPPEEWHKLALQTIEEGTRNHTIARISGLLLRRLPEPRLAAELVACFNQVKCDPPIEAAELKRTLDSIAAREMRRRGLT